MIYVLQVATGREMAVREELSKMYFGAMVPREICLERRDGELEEREKALFPGYVFVDMLMNLKAYYKIKDVKHVIKFLGGGDPEVLPQSEAEYILWLTNNGKPLAPSEMQPDGTVVSGPLAGHEERIVSVNKRQRRAKITANIMGQPHDINLSVSIQDDETGSQNTNTASKSIKTSKTDSKRRG